MEIQQTPAMASPAPASILDRSTSRAAATALTSGVNAQAVGAEAAERTDVSANAEQVAQALKSINFVLQTRSQDLEFSVDSDSAQLIVKVTDKNTKEVIRQMPTKEALEIAKALDHLQSLLKPQTA